MTCSANLDVPISALDSEPLPPDSQLAKASSTASVQSTWVGYGGASPTDGWRLVREDDKEAVAIFGDGDEIVALVLTKNGDEYTLASDHYCEAGTDLGPGPRHPGSWRPTLPSGRTRLRLSLS